MLARAIPLTDGNRVEKWLGTAFGYEQLELSIQLTIFTGTCTDIHDSTLTKIEATKMRRQLQNVITHANATIFTLDLSRRLTMLEGALYNKTIDLRPSEGGNSGPWYIGRTIGEVHEMCTGVLCSTTDPLFLAIEDIFDGKKDEDMVRHQLGKSFLIMGCQLIRG
jgi:hypothetical protein